MTQEGKSKREFVDIRLTKSMFSKCKVDVSTFTSEQVHLKWFMIPEDKSKVKWIQELTHVNGSYTNRLFIMGVGT